MKAMNVNLTTKIYLGFGAVLVLAVVISGFGIRGLMDASDTFGQYRNLARQTNADGRIQANMLMTRIFAKNFVISASADNIEGVRERAQRTLEMIKRSTELSAGSEARRLLVEDLRRDLETYVAQFEKVTEWQRQRDELVRDRLNVLGPETERALTEIMQSALKDGDTLAAYEAGVTLRSLMLGRLYANRFLIQNDDASVDRAMREFRDMELHVEKLLGELQDPKRRELAEAVKQLQAEYMGSFVDVRRVIANRNALITHQLDRIGPEVADRIERLTLAIKKEQDTLGPRAQKSIAAAETISVVVSIIAIIFVVVVAGWIAASVSRPIRALTEAADAMAAGDLDQVVDTERGDEVGTLAKAFVAMRSAIDDKVRTLQDEVAERTKAEAGLAAAEAELRRNNERLEETVKARTAELAAKETQLRSALANMSEGIFSLDEDLRYVMFNDRYVEMTGLPADQIAVGRPMEEVVRLAAEAGYYGPGDAEEQARVRMAAMASKIFEEVESTTADGRILIYRKSPLADGGATVVVSDVTERREAERKLESAYEQISSSIE
ncbi:MAG: PAS-domain containing protein, partial [Magnetovibrio sp.]|nr:PAS-domain containing protein [Magnetovibrio sp.]